MEIINHILKSISDEDIIEGEIIIPEGVTEIESGVFSYHEINKIKLPSTLEKINGNTFYDCDIEILEIPEGVKIIEPSAFYGMYSLKQITIPGTIEILGYDLLESCSSLERIIIHEGIEKIPEGLARDCCELQEIIIPNTVKSIGLRAFYECTNLKSIIIPSSVEELEEGAFESCSNLEEIHFSKGLKKIGKSAFARCTRLQKIELPETLEKIEARAFEQCSNLKEIYLPSSLRTIKDKAVYASCNLTTLVTPWGMHELEGSNTNSLIKGYIYLYVNHLLKTKYSCLHDLSKDQYVGPLIDEKTDVLYETDDAIYKFKTLYSKMRRSYDITPSLLEALKPETVKNFNYKIWKQIKDLLPWEDFPLITKAFANMIEIFGLFYNDKEQSNRIATFIKLFTERNYKISFEEYEELLLKHQEELDKIRESFEMIEASDYFFNLYEIPSQFEIYLKNMMTEDEIKKLKKINGTFGRELNDFIKESYITFTDTKYELIETEFSSQIRKYLIAIDLNNHPNIYNIQTIFEECNELYDKDFYAFLIKNIEIILCKRSIQKDLSNIQSRFKTIKDYYRYLSGNKMPSIKQALDYLSDNIFNFRPGNYELALEVKKAGVTEQEAFDYYQQQFEINDIRRKYSLIRRSNIYTINGYTIKAELLRKDDPFTMLVGEDNYTNCCQKYHGAGHNCMVHAVKSLDSGIFITKLLQDGEEILLTESWDWQNNNLYCHDNVEGTLYFKRADISLKQAVAEAIRLDGDFIIEKSEEEVEKFIQSKRRLLDKLRPEEKEKELKELEELAERNKIKIVTVGEGNDDLGIEIFYSNRIKVGDEETNYPFSPFQPVEYDFSNKNFDSECDFYSDSCNYQYIISGNINHLFSEYKKPLIPIYLDERRIVLEKGEQIRNYTFNKANKIKTSINGMEISLAQNKKQNSIYLGEDWYIMCKEQENQNLHILDIAKANPQIEDEKGIQLGEIIHTIYSLMKDNKKVEAYLEGDRIIKLYQINKKLGYIEPIVEEMKSNEKENLSKNHVIFKQGPNFSGKEYVKIKTI